MNALKHGLAAKEAVLPGEDVGERVRRYEDALVAFGATNEPVARLVFGIEDDLAKLERVDRVERGLILGRIEELTAQTNLGERAKKTAYALRLLGSALVSLERDPIPAERGPELDRRLQVMQGAVNVVAETVEDAPLDLVAACHRYLTPLADTRAHPTLPAASLAGLDGAARQLMAWLVASGERDEAAQVELRKAIAGIALPAEAELKKLARYVKMIEESLTRRLAVLEQLRNITASVSPATEEQAKEYRLRLRVMT